MAIVGGTGMARSAARLAPVARANPSARVVLRCMIDLLVAPERLWLRYGG